MRTSFFVVGATLLPFVFATCYTTYTQQYATCEKQICGPVDLVCLDQVQNCVSKAYSTYITCLSGGGSSSGYNPAYCSNVNVLGGENIYETNGIITSVVVVPGIGPSECPASNVQCFPNGAKSSTTQSCAQAVLNQNSVNGGFASIPVAGVFFPGAPGYVSVTVQNNQGSLTGGATVSIAQYAQQICNACLGRGLHSGGYADISASFRVVCN